MVARETRRRLQRAAQYVCAAQDEGGFVLAIFPIDWLQLTYDPGAPSLRLLLGLHPKPAELSRLEIQWYSEIPTQRKRAQCRAYLSFAFSHAESHLMLF